MPFLLLAVLVFAAAHGQAPGPGTHSRLPGGANPQPEAANHPDWPGTDAHAPNAEAKAPESTCATCHLSQAKSQPLTPMGQAMVLPGNNPVLQAHPLLTFKRGAYTYTVTEAANKITYSVSDGTKSIAVPVRWSMGVGAQTWVLERDGKLYESLVSYYPAITGLDVTTGDEVIKPKTVEEALGRPVNQNEAKSCFGCHSSNSLVDGRLSFERVQPGLNCEHCHEGALAHAADADQGSFESVPPRLRSLSSEGMSHFCGQCHRTWDMVVRSHWHGPANARFQPYRLANSRCFDGTDPRISCVACHDPHQDVVRGTAFYDSKCLACHAPGLAAVPGKSPEPTGTTAATTVPRVGVPGLGAVGTAREEARSCPVAKSDCASCHMPKVTLPSGGGHLVFTDHDIRIARAGDPYPF